MTDVCAFSFDPPLTRDVGIVYRSGEQSPPAAAAFIATAAEMATSAVPSTEEE